jgi:AcrR family transcriptional regulator
MTVARREELGKSSALSFSEPWHDLGMGRAEHREQQMAAILEAARRQLAEKGAAGLSLREVAREVGMVSSAVYRYVPSRDDLLTLLITTAFDEMGEAVEQADAARRRSDLRGRFRAVGHAVRDWAHAHPHDYALVYGSPVPGYSAPPTTVVAATRVVAVLGAIVVDAATLGRLAEPGPATARGVRSAIDVDALATVMPGIPPMVALRALMVWTDLFGHVSLELFGHFGPVLADPDRAFTLVLDELADLVGIA